MSGLPTRAEALASIANGSFDVLVVGGGIAGAGVLLEAACRGYRAALVERRDFASGTSSRSSKLIHGGLRYVTQAQFALVRDSLRERAALQRLAPTLVRPMPHLFPLRSRAHALAVRATLTVYELLGARPRHRVLGPDVVAEQEPWLAPLATHGAASYSEAQADDVRLVYAVLLAAAARGAVAVNHVSAASPTSRRGELTIELRDELSSTTLHVAARNVILAVGAHLARFDAGRAFLLLRPAKGIHLVLKERPPRTAVVVRSPRDGRYLTAMPWHGHVLLGTTDTPVRMEDIDRPRVDRTDVDYLLEAVAPIYPDAAHHIRAAWAGIRPLVDADAPTTPRLSREEQIVSPQPGVWAIAGGKLTTFRAIARRVMAEVDRHLGRRSNPTDVELLDPLPPDGELLVRGLPFTRSQLTRAAREGMTATLDDLLTHRLGVTLLAPDSVVEHAAQWADVVAADLGWSPANTAREADAARARAREFLSP